MRHAHNSSQLSKQPVYRAWHNLQQANAMLQPSQAPLDPDDAAGIAGAHRATLAEALRELPADEPMQDAPGGNVAQVLSAQVAAQTAPEPPKVSESPILLTAEDREAYGVGRRATEMVERILAIPWSSQSRRAGKKLLQPSRTGRGAWGFVGGGPPQLRSPPHKDPREARRLALMNHPSRPRPRSRAHLRQFLRTRRTSPFAVARDQARRR